MIIRIDSIDKLSEIVYVLHSLIEEGYSVVLLSGELGAGKTTLVQHICKSYGVDQQVSSPTFSIIQEYMSPLKGPIIHMDLYRLEKPQELEQIGFAEYLDSGQLCIIEWPDVGNDYFVMPYIRVDISVENNDIRNFKISTHDAMDA
ncbi:MAG: tRNA (adenosine(37)-N6)-threonylcarbamoyltransferase complex ATPase subunit type 1 TsaE [Saprospiraceae bacterium]|uniref:tRNA threonylcarbamoyladenosine biosynthesis protein TsaE n=1 Tax=Candidatus Opimibacter skivensis TaxID=2982028 RepID=A0A9D7SVP3_9BACT|nr:tRNA (adenosine(37)-N6)-threonylcarbamoyltransferase complex ATPase subunit type 1 TsaE [Candidatus Opimibacter skivensis]